MGPLFLINIIVFATGKKSFPVSLSLKGQAGKWSESSKCLTQ